MKRIVLICFLIVGLNQIYSKPATIKVNGQDVFLNGMNLAWINFANDLGAGYDQANFTKAVTSIHAAGGNVIRWWIHVNGTNNPSYTNDSVTGINIADLKTLKNALDIAYENGVMIDLCLWSFDMLQGGLNTAVTARNLKLLNDSNYTRKYINNALIPMVKYLNNHPGILCWEVFNEPEGMISNIGYTSGTGFKRVAWSSVQRVVNMVAGAIHRVSPTSLVSNGSQLIAYSSDVDNFSNYYRADRLLSIGGDPLGYLDFYMVHYYTSNGSKYSLFSKPASHWNLDKPIVIGEFPALGFPSETPKMSAVDAYKYAAANGYAGAMSWTYSNGSGGATGGDKNGGLPDCAAALDTIEALYKNYVDIQPSNSFVFTPSVVKSIPERMVFLGKTDTITLGNLKDIFAVKGDVDDTSLKFKVDSQKNIANLVIDPNGILKIVPKKISGIFTTTISAINKNDTTKTCSTTISFSVVDTNSVNRLQFRNVYSSTIENVSYLPTYSVDSLQKTRWSTEYKDNQWLLINMAKKYELQQMKIHWEAAFGKQYEVQVSTDSINWQTVYTENNSDGGYDWILFKPVVAKYLRLNCIKRGTQWGFSIYEIEAYSTRDSDIAPIIVKPLKDDTIIGNKSTNLKFISNTSDPNIGDKIVQSFYALTGATPTWLSYNDSSKILTCSPKAADTGLYHLVFQATDMQGKFATDTFSILVTYTNPVSVHTANIDNFEIYPNPARNLIKVSSLKNIESPVEVSVVDFSGRIVLLQNTKFLKNSLLNINLSGVASGIYILRLSRSSGVISKVIQVKK
jgi:hypothetical protein